MFKNMFKTKFQRLEQESREDWNQMVMQMKKKGLIEIDGVKNGALTFNLKEDDK